MFSIILMCFGINSLISFMLPFNILIFLILFALKTSGYLCLVHNLISEFEQFHSFHDLMAATSGSSFYTLSECRFVELEMF